MLLLYILLGIILLFLIILLIPIKIIAKYRLNNFILYLKFAFFKLNILPSESEDEKEKKKSKKRKKSKKVKEADQKNKTDSTKERNISWFIDLLKKIANLAQGVLKDLFKHIIIKKMLISISVAGENAAETAINYGHYCSVVYPAVGIIAEHTKCEKYGVDISPNFEEKANSNYEVDFEAKVRLIWILILIFKHGFKAIELFAEFK